ncbi:MAG: hypothetical protein KIS88_09750 [Anaerolineales bacterium]|nr:hypothetical protein [Anaerolineales bacterium]
MRRLQHAALPCLLAALAVAGLACSVTVDLGQSPLVRATVTPDETLEASQPAMPGILLSGDLANQQEALVSLYETVSQGVVSLNILTRRLACATGQVSSLTVPDTLLQTSMW